MNRIYRYFHRVAVGMWERRPWKANATPERRQEFIDHETEVLYREYEAHLERFRREHPDGVDLYGRGATPEQKTFMHWQLKKLRPRDGDDTTREGVWHG